jgi:Tol biopolymer transport system component
MRYQSRARQQGVVAALLLIVVLAAGCVQTRVVELEITTTPRINVVEVTATPTITPEPTFVSNSGGMVAFYSQRDGNAEIYVIDVGSIEPGSHDEQRLTHNDFDDVCPAWSPDGTQIVFISDRNDPAPVQCFPECNYDIYIMNADGSDQRRLTNTSTSESHPAWSPDGKQLTLDVDIDGDGNGEIYLLNVAEALESDGADGLRPLTSGEADDRWADWSSDGAQIVFSSNRDGDYEIYVMAADGTNQRQITYNDIDDFFPTWSPDGTQIAFFSKSQGRRDQEIYVMTVSNGVGGGGTDVRQLTNLSAVSEDPAWSSDGTQIVFQSDRDGNFEIYVMDADGGAQRRLTTNQGGDYWPAWHSQTTAAAETQVEWEAATLSSLERVDDYPLYTMHYYGDYSQSAMAIGDGRVELAFSTPDWACSLFAALGDTDNMLYGRNFDWQYSPALLLFTDPPDGYASVSMVDIEYLVGADVAGRLTDLPLEERRALLDAPFWPFDGMNEHGLVIGMAAVPPGDVPPDPNKETIDSLGVMREVLDQARDTDEAVAILQSYNINMGGGPPLHYLVTDPSGHSILVEFYQGETVLIPNPDDEPWHQATNFLRSSVGESAVGECWRYDRISERLVEVKGRLTASGAMDLLSEVSQEGTQWSIVYGLSTGDVTVTMGRAYDNQHTFHLGFVSE